MRGPRGEPERNQKEKEKPAVVPLRESRMAIVIAVARAIYRGEEYRRVKTKAFPKDGPRSRKKLRR